MSLRFMEINDLKRIIELEKQLFIDESWSEKDFLYEMNENDFSFNYVLEENHQIIGYVGLWLLYEQAQIITIGVDKAYQNSGYGSYMMEKMIDLSRYHGCSHMSLEVRVSNIPAIALYKRYGFEIEAIRKNYYRNYEDAYLMVKRLEGHE
ncbi:MAG: ribosomal protein S18-alanine N-acetyltransferase [Erysipelotrichaceae bacterium]|nr:ribosomal protein S18-alanine N-acetyltransferase [Erysipelotrichaceae bacterium]